MNKTNNVLLALLSAIWMFSLTSCNSLKYVPENKNILHSYHIDWSSVDISSGEKRAIERELEEALRPSPNGTFLGMRPGLWASFRKEKEKGKWLTSYIERRYGEKPVYIEDISRSRIQQIIGNRLENNGLFFYDIDFEIDQKRKNTARLVVKVRTTKPYRLHEYLLDEIEGDIFTEIQAAFAKTNFREGDLFNLDRLKNERTRIQDFLRLRGYFYFSNDHLVFEMDTTNVPVERGFSLHLRLKDGVLPRSIQRFSIGSVSVNSQINEPDSAKTPITYRDVWFDSENYILSKRVRPLITLEPGDVFSLENQRQTNRYLNSLRNFSHASIRFSRPDTTEDRLDVGILLTPALPRSFRAELQALTRSNNFAGPALNFTYSNRNIFKGGETFRLNTVTSFETQLGSGFDGAYSYEFGISGEIDFPRVLFRGDQNNYTSYSLPRTRTSLGTNFLRRAGFYTLNTLNARLSFLWQSSEKKTHNVNALDVLYSNLLNTTPAFDEILNSNPFLRRSFERQFIPAIGYTYTYSQLSEQNRAARMFVILHGETSGNTLGLVPGLDGELWGVPFSQYIKGEVDFRMNHRLGKDRNLVWRTFTGYGYSYGESMSLPFVKQYFSGGPNSIRSFRIRSLGPGGYINPDPNRIGAFFDQSGDIQLEMNLEYRFPISSIFKGAWFVDAGNIWLLRDNPNLPNGQFTSDFYQQIAIGGGFGLRFDLNVLVIRFDFATPIRKHAADVDQQLWPIQEFRPWQRSWYRDGLIVNFALGYPF
jgi:outer membrane protein insertion porin family